MERRTPPRRSRCPGRAVPRGRPGHGGDRPLHQGGRYPIKSEAGPTGNLPDQTRRDEGELQMVNPLATLRQTKLRIDKVENASVPPNTERTLCNRSGPGVVASLWMALGGGAAPALDGRLRVYYDGSPTPTIDIDMVKEAYSSGTPTIGVGPGNCPATPRPGFAPTPTLITRRTWLRAANRSITASSAGRRTI